MVARPHSAPSLALAAACVLAACVPGDNPAFKSTSTLPATEADTTGAAATTGIDDTCPDGQPPQDWWPDEDGDGYGDRNADPVSACEPPTGHVADGRDCKDDVAAVHPGVTEVCNNADDNCDSLIDGPECGACKILTTQGYVYWVCPLPKGEPAIPWQEAEQRCSSFSNRYPVSLLSVHDVDEYNQLIPLVEKFIDKDKQGIHHAWIGLSKLEQYASDCDVSDTKSVWQWTDNSPVDLTAWNPGEPSNSTGLCTCGEPMCPYENCVEMRIDRGADQFGWNDAPCDLELVRGFICKTKRDPELFPAGP